MRSVLIRSAAAVIVLCGLSACMKRHPTIEYAQLQHPFQGAQLYVDADTLAHAWQAEHAAPWLEPITGTPQARWLIGPDDLTRLAPVVADAERQDRLLVVVAYYIPNRDCAGQGAADPAAYQAWVARLRDALAPVRAVVILEPDAVAADCFDEPRARALAGAVRTLAGAGHYVYLDGGHSRWRPAAEMSERLHAAGIADAEGFSVNVSNRQSTADSHRYATELSDLTGGRDAIIDTSRNGLTAPPDDQWCNPAEQGLGERPTVDPGLDHVAARLWVKHPGESDGACGTETTTEAFSPRQAQTLIVNSSWVPEPTRRQAAAAQL